ncbi:MAG: YceI family protein [Chloroflexi bacterium]|nr:YceI family protein [Chloroflexota bacterium]
MFEVVPGTEARYRVKEQLARLNFPTDAVGVTQEVKGTITLGPDNTVVIQGSRLVVDLRTLRSDEGRRDSYIRENTLETARYPLAEFAPTRIVGLPAPLPMSGEVRFQMAGDMTLHGVTRPLTWEVNATFGDQNVTGRATASFRFGDFAMRIPRVFLVLSVEDDIRLEVELRLQRKESGA